MSGDDISDLFRDEALEFHARHRGPGEVMRVASEWIDRLYWLLLVVVAAGAVLAWVIEVDGRSLLDILLRGR
jgi:hypothetical protein